VEPGLNQEYDCAECGLCCTEYGSDLHLYEEDVRRWREADETQVLRRLRVIGETATAWYSPDNGQKETACPFLTSADGYRCAIYPARPLVCRHFANGGSACRELRARHGLPVEESY
jgi:Fe-S-cluster containining protein